MDGNTIVCIEIELEHETERAFLAAGEWIPKSQIQNLDEVVFNPFEPEVVLELPEWLVIAKELDGYVI